MACRWYGSQYSRGTRGRLGLLAIIDPAPGWLLAAHADRFLATGTRANCGTRVRYYKCVCVVWRRGRRGERDRKAARRWLAGWGHVHTGVEQTRRHRRLVLQPSTHHHPQQTRDTQERRAAEGAEDRLEHTLGLHPQRLGLGSAAVRRRLRDEERPPTTVIENTDCYCKTVIEPACCRRLQEKGRNKGTRSTELEFSSACQLV